MGEGRGREGRSLSRSVAVPPSLADETTRLLLAQVGTQAAYRFAEQLRELGLLRGTHYA